MFYGYHWFVSWMCWILNSSIFCFHTFSNQKSFRTFWKCVQIWNKRYLANEGCYHWTLKSCVFVTWYLVNVVIMRMNLIHCICLIRRDSLRPAPGSSWLTLYISYSWRCWPSLSCGTLVPLGCHGSRLWYWFQRCRHRLAGCSMTLDTSRCATHPSGTTFFTTPLSTLWRELQRTGGIEDTFNTIQSPM